MVKRIGVIGAGYAGISTARVLKEFGFEVVVWEKEPDIGGVWSSNRRYPGLTTQNPRDTYYLSELPMPKSYPEWPTGEQVQTYMQSYVDKFELNDMIKTSREVLSTKQLPDGSWTVFLRDGETGTDLQEHVDYLIVCNGIFSVPFVPDYDGADAFRKAGGQLLHTSEFVDQESAKGKHVLVVGYGKSSCDVARAMIGRAEETTVVARNLIWKIPKKIGNVLNFKNVMLTRLGEGLFKYIRVRGFERFLHSPFGWPIRKIMMGSLQSVIGAQLKLKKLGLHPQKPLETIARSTVSLVTDGFYPAIEKGDISIKKNASIVELSPGHAKLSTGETLKADIIVCGTGWRQEIPFLDPFVKDKTLDDRGDFRLFRTMLPVGVKNIAFNGYNSSFFSQLNCEIGALWIADHLMGGIALPNEATQNSDIDERLKWMRERTDGKYSKGTNIIPFSMHHIDELLSDIELNVGPMTRLGQWFSAVDPGSYKVLLPKLLKRYEKQLSKPSEAPRPSKVKLAAAK